MDRTNIIILFMAAALLATAACQPAQPATRATDDSGTFVALDKPAEKIISLAPSNTEMAYYLGLQDRLAGVTEYCNYPPEAKNKPRVGGFSTVDVEKVVSLQPDLVLAADIHSKSATPMLEKLGFRVATFKPKTMNSVIDDFSLLARLCGIPAQSEIKITALKNRVEAITAQTRGLAEKNKRSVLIVIWHDPLMAAGGNTLGGDIIRLAGGVNIADKLEGHANLGIETVLSADPQVIIVPTSMGESGSKIRDAITRDTRLKDVAAVRNNSVYTIDGDVLLRYGPRSVDALEQVAALLYPGLFGK